MLDHEPAQLFNNAQRTDQTFIRRRKCGTAQKYLRRFINVRDNTTHYNTINHVTITWCKNKDFPHTVDAAADTDAVVEDEMRARNQILLIPTSSSSFIFIVYPSRLKQASH